MKNYIIALLTLFCIGLKAQTDPFQIKESYDRTYSHYVPFVPNYANHTFTGNSLSWTLSSLLKMYEATNDKAYLLKFINHVIAIQNHRLDKAHPGDPTYPPKWTLDLDVDCGGNECTYFNSLLINSMAEFVYLVISHPDIYNTNILDEIIDDESMSPTATILGYGDFALWLGARVEETILYMNSEYWDYDFGIKKSNDLDDNLAAELNMQSFYGSALVYIGMTFTNFGYGDNHSTYLYQAQIIANHIKGDIYIDDKCNDLIYDNPVLKISSDDSYVWFHQGWRLEEHNCAFHSHNISVPKYIAFQEDVSHGAMDLTFVKTCYETELAPCTLCPPYFTATELTRFRNTLIKNIYYTDLSGTHFHNTVDGSDNGFANNTCSPLCPSDLYFGEVLDWMHLYKFDEGTGPKLYDIILNHAIGLLATNATWDLTGEQSYLGLSEVVKAQWDKECVNLTLYNRDVIYDQDFIVKNILKVAPQQVDSFHYLGQNSFADPITNENTFIIRNSTTVNMMAGEYIELLPGFTAENGSNFTASINPSACTDGKLLVISNSSFISGQQDLTNPLIELKPLVNLQVNVDTDKNLVWLQSENTNDKNQSLLITDLTGRVIKSYDHLPASVNTNEMPPACYIFCYTTINGRASQKVFIR